MKMFSLCPRDQMRQSWVLCVEGKARERNKTAKDTFRNVHALLGSAVTGEIRMKPQYNSIRCGLCRRYDSARAFEVGFDDTATIRIKGDFGYTTDRIFVISDKLLSTLKTHQIGGFESKPLGKTGWHAFQANRFVESNDSVIQTAGALCPECGRPEDSWGSYQRLSDLVPPEERNTFFTTKRGCPSRPFYDSQTFLTEDVMTALVGNSITGGYCYRLWTDKEAEMYELNRRRGVDKYPAGTTVYLNGSIPKK